MKRFWGGTAVVRVEGRYAVELDGRRMRLPGGPVLALESAALAAAIAAEWQAAGETLTADDVPLTRIAGTAQERVAPDPAPTAAALARYAEDDLLCYRVSMPVELAERQQRQWQPWLDWAATRHGARLTPVQGVIHQPQPDTALAALHRAVAQRPPFELAGLGILVPALGSLVLGLAVADAALAPDEAHRLSLLDEFFQAERWGEDLDALGRRRAMADDIDAASRFIRLSRPEPAPAG